MADALATVREWPCLLEYSTEADPPVPLPNVALKLSCTYPADDLFGDEDDEEAEDDSFDISMNADAEDADEYETSQPHNIFYLEDVFLRVEP